MPVVVYVVLLVELKEYLIELVAVVVVKVTVVPLSKYPLE